MSSALYDLLVGGTKKVAKDSPDYSNHYSIYEGGPYWTSDPAGESVIRYAKEGIASEASFPASTVSQAFKEAVVKKGNKVIIRAEELPPLEGNDIPPPLPLNKWKSWTYKEFYDDCKAVAKALIKVGMVQHDAVNIFGFNSRPWFVANMAAILAGGKSAGIYPTDNEEQLQFKVDHSNGAVLFVENDVGFGKIKAVIDDVPYLKAVVTWSCEAGEDLKRSDGSTVTTMNFEDFLKMGEGLGDEELENRIDTQKPTHACSLIYTSGTTGKPKAVMISHDNILFESFTVIKELKTAGIATRAEEERVISYLPLSHVAGLMVDIITPIVIATFTPAWVSANMARPYDLKKGSIGQRLTTVEPTIFIGVPRVWEKIMEKLKAAGASSQGLKKDLVTAAKRRALAKQINLQIGGSGKSHLGFPYTTLLGLIKGKLGLNKCRYTFAGAAPMTKECLEYFGALDINVNEVYGMSECTGACTWSTDDAHTWGSVGFELDGCEVKILKEVEGKYVEVPRAQSILHATEAEQGEVCFRGRNIMMGYMANPRLGEDHMETIEKKNAGAIDDEGWLHSGDKGCIDVHGMLKITGRYKELIIGAGGENIAPVPIEDHLKKLMPAISNVMMYGDKKKFNVALLSLKVEGATGELPGGEDLTGPALEVSPESKTISQAMNDPNFIQYLKDGFEATNNNGEVVVSNAAKIQKFTILPADFSVETGELTATLKLKRSVVADKYKDAIDKLYESSEVYVNCFE